MFQILFLSDDVLLQFNVHVICFKRLITYQSVIKDTSWSLYLTMRKKCMINILDSSFKVYFDFT